MLSVIQRYKVRLIILGILAVMALLSWFILNHGSNKTPSRGVFVTNSVLEHYTRI